MKPKGILHLSGEKLRCAAMPLGGIGTGTIAIGGDGLLKQWQIMNNVNHRAFVPNSFFAVGIRNVENSNEPSICRALICPDVHVDPNFKAAKSVSDHWIGGAIKQMFNVLPGVKEIEFDGEYPFSFLRFKDQALPLDIRLTAFNPFIPLDAKNSGLPLIIFQFYIKNTSDRSLEITILGNLLNFLGWDGIKKLNGEFSSLFGGNINVHKQIGDWNAIHMRSKTLLKNDRRFGDLTLAIDQSNTMVTPQWSNLEKFWSQFSRKCVLPESESEEISLIGQTWAGSLGSKKILNPNESTIITFILAWNFPNRVVDWHFNIALIPDDKTDYWIGNRYNEWFKNSIKVIEYAREYWAYLLNKTSIFHEAFYSTTLPSEVLTSISATSSAIRTPTCFWKRDGSFHGFEGCHGASTGKLSGGCCPLDCTHVWNYEFSLAHLFPSLERTMRETEFNMQHKSGFLPHRSVIPLYLPQFGMTPDPGDIPPALDGMFGMVLKIYRDFLITGDLKFLEKSWPHIQRLMEYIIKKYDNNLKGVIYNEQNNTYDCSIFGINSFIGSLYLIALLVCEEITKQLNIQELSYEFRNIFNSGSLILDNECWNGEYYIQKYDENKIKEFQYGIGCFSDQLIGQWWAFHLGFEYILPPEHVNKAVESILKYNFKDSFQGIKQTPRILASPSDSGLVNCTWPHGNKPTTPTYYSDEVWTGIEYEIAALCVYTGKISEALKIIKAIRKRYDGTYRSPWNEVECGDHYVRPMSSWTLLHAFTGVTYSMELKQFKLKPKITSNNFQTFFITGNAWGQISQKFADKKFTIKITVSHGNYELNSIILGALADFIPIECNKCILISQEGKEINLKPALLPTDLDNIAKIRLQDTIILNEGQIFQLELI